MCESETRKAIYQELHGIIGYAEEQVKDGQAPISDIDDTLRKIDRLLMAARAHLRDCPDY